MIRALGLLALLSAGSCVVRVPPTVAPVARTCTFIEVGRDSVFVATYAPPCSQMERPAGDTVKSWRLPTKQPGCPMQGVIDELRGEVHFRWLNCHESGYEPIRGQA